MRFRLSRLLTTARPPPTALIRQPLRSLVLYRNMASAEIPPASGSAPHPVQTTAQPAPPAPGPNAKKEKKAKPAGDAEAKAPLEVLIYMCHSRPVPI